MAQKLHRVNRTWFPGTGLVFPNALTTGVPAGTALTTLTSATNAAAVGGLNSGWSWDGVSTLSITASNAVVDSVSVAGTIKCAVGSPGVSNVTIQTSKVVNSVGGASSNCINLTTTATAPISGLTIRRCTLAGGNSGSQRVNTCIQDHNGFITGLLISGCDISNHRTGIICGEGLITANYLHDIGYVSGDHTNGMLTPVAPLVPAGPGAVLTIAGNTIYTNHSETDAIMLDPNNKTTNIGNTTITGNLVAGGSGTLYLGWTGQNNTSYLTVTNNYFSTRYYLNAGSSATHLEWQTPANGGTGNVWSGNVWYDGPLAGQLIPA